METLNPTQDANAQVNVNTQANEPNVETTNTVEQPVQVTATAQGMNYVMPTALAGQPLVAPKAIQAKLIRATVRSERETGKELILLEFAGFPAPVIRSLAQVKGDLADFYTREQLGAMSSTLASASYNRYFRNKLTNMEVSYHQAGAIQTIDANSKLYINGLKAIGDQVPTENEGVWIEGFLSVHQTDAELDNIIERELKAIADRSKAEAGFSI